MVELQDRMLRVRIPTEMEIALEDEARRLHLRSSEVARMAIAKAIFGDSAPGQPTRLGHPWPMARKLRAKDAEDIRRLAGKYTYDKLASLFGVSAHHIAEIVAGRRWCAKNGSSS